MIVVLVLMIMILVILGIIKANERPESISYTKSGNDYNGDAYELTIYNYTTDLTIELSEFNPETDWNWKYLGGGAGAYMTVVGDTHYVRLSEYVYVCSPETGEILPLCAKPDCLHDKEEDYTRIAYCTANVLRGFGRSSIQYYQGKLYANANAKASYIENADLTESSFPGDYVAELSLDGTEKDFLNAKCDSAYDLLIHRGNIYYINDVSDGAEDVFEVRELPLEGGDYHIIAKLRCGMGTRFKVFCYGNYLYLVADQNLILYDILSQTATVKELSIPGIILYVSENVLYGVTNIAEGITNQRQPTQIYSLDWEGENLELFLTLQNTGSDRWLPEDLINNNPYISMDEKYIYQVVEANDTDYLIVYDRNDGKPMQRIELNGLNYYVRPGVEEDRIWLVPYIVQDDPVLWLEKDRILEENVTFHELTR